MNTVRGSPGSLVTLYLTQPLYLLAFTATNYTDSFPWEWNPAKPVVRLGPLILLGKTLQLKYSFQF